MVKILKVLSVLSSLGMLLVLIGGSLVTKTNSGMGCGANWPLCEGQLIPSNITPQLIIELSHRAISAGVGVFVLLLAILSWKYIGHIRETKLLSFLSLFFLVLQALIGAAAVLWGQSKFILAIHFGISLISFAAVFLLTLLIFEIDKKFDAKSLVIDKGLRTHFYALMGYILVVVYTGALVRHAKASLVCGDWPFCDNQTPFSFDFSIEQWIQMGHRLAAAFVFIWVLYIFFRIKKQYRHSKIMYWGWMIALLVVILQVTLGALIIFTILNLYIALLHSLVISLFFGLLSYFVLLSTRSTQTENEHKQKKASAL